MFMASFDSHCQLSRAVQRIRCARRLHWCLQITYVLLQFNQCVIELFDRAVAQGMNAPARPQPNGSSRR